MPIYNGHAAVRAAGITAALVTSLVITSDLPSQPEPGRRAAPRDSTPRYAGDVRLDPAHRVIESRWTLRLPRHRADSVILLVNAGLSDVSVTGPRVTRVQMDTTGGLGRVRVTLRATPSPQEVQLTVVAHGTLEMGTDGINSVSADYSELGLDTFWFPVLHGFPDITGTVRLTIPADLQIVSSGRVSEERPARDGWRTFALNSSVPLPDFAFVAARTLSISRGDRAQAVTTTADSGLVRAMLQVTDACTGYLVSRFGAGVSIPTVTIVLPPRIGPGYARKHYIVVPVGEWHGEPDSAQLRAQQQTNFVCHELAHYWSSGAVASGPENLINEGFAEFVSARAVRALRGDGAYAVIEKQWRARAARAGAVWTATATKRPDANAAYGKAPLLLASLEARVGSETMDRILRVFMTRRVRTTKAVLDLIAAEANRDTAEWFERQLSGAP